MNNKLTNPPGPGLNLLRRILGIKPKPLTRAEWWAWYSDYLKTPQWHRRADRCKQRAGYTCQRCGIKAGAIRPDGSRAWMEAHHLSYKHVGDERDSELECDCDYCHKGITEGDKAK